MFPRKNLVVLRTVLNTNGLSPGNLALTSSDGYATTIKEETFMKMFKRIMAAGAALMMAVTGMTMSASASSWRDYYLHYYPNIPASENKTTQTLGSVSDPAYKVAVTGTFKMLGNISNMNCNYITMQGQVRENHSVMGQYVWSNATPTLSVYNTGYTSTYTYSYSYADYGYIERINLSMNYSSGSISSSSGSAIAW